MAKTPICNSKIFFGNTVTGDTEYFRAQGTTMYCKVLGFTGVFWGGRGYRGVLWLLQGTWRYYGVLGVW